ncbi:hypothetical protein SEVIR_5G422000v4 [Setaria viridis]
MDAHGADGSSPRTPFRELPNTGNRGNQNAVNWRPQSLDPKEVKRQRDNSRAASMSDERRNGLNKRRRESYMREALDQSWEGEPPECTAAHTMHRPRVTPGERNSLLTRRNRRFESTIARKAKGTANTNLDDTNDPTQSGATQSDARKCQPTSAHGNDAATQTQPSVIDCGIPGSSSVNAQQANAQASMGEGDGDENLIFEEEDKEDEGYLFAGQGDDWDANVDVDLEMANEDASEPDVPDPYGQVYANVPEETHMLKAMDNCEHCNAKKFESEPPLTHHRNL